MIFSRLQLPQTLAALGIEIIQGKAEKEEKALFVHSNLLRATQTAKGRKKEKKKQNPQTFLVRLEAMNEDLEVFQLNLCSLPTFPLH